MKALHQLGDDELFLEFKSGRESAYKEIYERYWELLYKHANGMLANEEEAKDVVQDVFFNLWKLRQSKGAPKPLGPFLFCATRNAVLNKVKHLKVAQKYELHVKHMITGENRLPDDYVIEKELALKISSGIDNLPVKMREIFNLSRNENLSHKEISDKLNISDKTVKRQISNALNVLRIKLMLHKYLFFFTFIYILFDS